MKELIATFYSHYGAMKFKKDIDSVGGKATLMPVPRAVSSSCGTCVNFDEIPDYEDFVSDEVEQIYYLDENNTWKLKQK